MEYNFSGIYFTLLTFCGTCTLLLVIGVLLSRPWAKGFKLKSIKKTLVAGVCVLCLSCFFVSRIVFPSVRSYTGEYIGESNTVKGLFSNKYRFWNGEGKRYVFKLDDFSVKKLTEEGFEKGKQYTIYYDSVLYIIVGVEEID